MTRAVALIIIMELLLSIFLPVTPLRYSMQLWIVGGLALAFLAGAFLLLFWHPRKWYWLIIGLIVNSGILGPLFLPLLGL